MSAIVSAKPAFNIMVSVPLPTDEELSQYKDVEDLDLLIDQLVKKRAVEAVMTEHPIFRYGDAYIVDKVLRYGEEVHMVLVTHSWG